MPNTAPWSLYQVTLKRTENGEFDHANEETKARAVSNLIQTSTSAAAVLALQPWPGVDSAIITPIHYRMVGGIARIRGHRCDRQAVYDDIVGPIGSRLLVHHVVMAAAKLVPFADIFAVPVAYALTCALGQLSDEYYRRGRAMSKREMTARFGALYANAYDQGFREKRNELRALFSNPEIRKQVDELKKAQREGAIGADEVAQRIDEIVNRR